MMADRHLNKIIEICEKTDLRMIHENTNAYNGAIILRKFYRIMIESPELSIREHKLLKPYWDTLFNLASCWYYFKAIGKHYDLTISRIERSGLEFLFELILSDDCLLTIQEIEQILESSELLDLKDWNRHLEKYLCNEEYNNDPLPEDELACIPRTHWWCFEDLYPNRKETDFPN